MKSLLSNGRRWLLVALALPIVGVIGFIARSEVSLRGVEWRFPIRGYDPRDLLRGHYLIYRIDWNIENQETRPCQRCCLCLTRQGARRQADRLECDRATRCNVRLSPDDERALSRFYVPEEEASKLERAVRAARAEIVLVERRGRLSIQELLINGQSWRLYQEPKPEP